MQSDNLGCKRGWIDSCTWDSPGSLCPWCSQNTLTQPLPQLILSICIALAVSLRLDFCGHKLAVRPLLLSAYYFYSCSMMSRWQYNLIALLTVAHVCMLLWATGVSRHWYLRRSYSCKWCSTLEIPCLFIFSSGLCVEGVHATYQELLMDLVQGWTRLPGERVETSRRDLPVSCSLFVIIFLILLKDYGVLGQ